MEKKKKSEPLFRSELLFRKALKALAWIVGLFLFGAVLYYAGIDSLKAIAQSDWRFLGITLLAVGTLTAATAIRWGLIANALAGRRLVSWAQYYHFNILGRVTGLFIPQIAGDIGTRTIALTATKSSGLGVAFSSTVIDRMFDALGTAILFFPSLLYVSKLIPRRAALGLSLLLMVLLAFVITARWSAVWRLLMKLVNGMAKLAGRFPLTKRAITPQRLEMLHQLTERPISSRLALHVYLLSMARLFLMIIRSYSVALALGIHAPFVTIYLIVPVAQLIMLLNITPMGLGMREAGWAAVLTLAGASPKDALIFALGHRAYLYVSVSVLGLISYASMILARKRASREKITLQAEIADPPVQNES